MPEAPERYNASRNPFIATMPPDQLSSHMAAIGARGNAERLVLSADEAAALGHAYALIDRIYQRHAAKLARAAEGEHGDD